MAGRKEKAFALIVVLWIVAIMGTITMMFSRQSRLSVKINKNAGQASQVELLAEAAVHHMMAILVQDELETTSDHKNEVWFDNQEQFYNVLLGNGMYHVYHPNLEETNMYHYGAMDECGKLNINTATKNMLMLLPNAEEEIIDAILDWRDEDDNPRTFGAESDYYMTLAEAYSAKNSKFDSIEELLLVKGMTLDILYGEDYNTNGVLDMNENDGTETFPLDNSDGTLDHGWYPYITAFSYEENVDKTGNQRININSADEDTLEQALGEFLTDDEIEAIIDTRDDEEFESIADLLGGGGGGGGGGRGGGGGNQLNLSKEKFKQIADRITTSDEDKLWGKVNLNIAPPVVLRCLLPNNEEAVEQILEYRQSENGYFDDIGELCDLEQISNNVLRQLISLGCTKSSVFSVRAVGTIEETRAYKELYALIDRGESPPKIRYWKLLR